MANQAKKSIPIKQKDNAQNPAPMANKIKSPYNFVEAPCENEVYIPSWSANDVHDKPFSDGESGEIELTITAETPIFIRNGHSKQDAEQVEKIKAKNTRTPDEQKVLDKYNAFSNIDGKYFIPGSSLKGMIRNVLEIMSYSRMKKVKGANENDILFGMRDMNNNDYKRIEINGVRSGWLKKINDEYLIYPCENHRISINNIEIHFKLKEGILKSEGLSAMDKYKLCNINKVNSKLKFNQTNALFINNGGKQINNGFEYKVDRNGDFEGSIVMFGDIGNKKYDYIFGKINDNVKGYKVDKELMKKFELMELQNSDSLLKYFVDKEIDEIPVFFKQDNNTIKHFGFSKLYRLNNPNYLSKLEPLKSYNFNNSKPDLAEIIFGYTDEERENATALKGRVFISHGLTENAKPQNNIEERILSNPRASFYPNYLKQVDAKGVRFNNFKTYHDNDTKLRGYKRYPVHNTIKPHVAPNDNENISSTFKPLNIDTTFRCKIRYHNLKKIELGALVSAISFHNQTDKFHSIGGAKPYGFGKVKIEVSNINSFMTCMQEFENEMNNHPISGKDWINTQRIKDLMSMASSPCDNMVDALLIYPILEPDNEFILYKKANSYLENYTKRNPIEGLTKLIDAIFLQDKNAASILADQNLQIEFDQIVSDGDDFLSNIDFDNAINKYNAALNHSKILQNKQAIQNKIIEAEAKKLQFDVDQMKLSDDIEAIKAFIEKNTLLDLQRAILNKRISELEEKKRKKNISEQQNKPLNIQGKNLIYFRNRLNGLVKVNPFNEPHKQEIINALLWCIENDLQSFKNNNRNKLPLKDKLWQDIIKWIGQNDAKNLFDSFN